MRIEGHERGVAPKLGGHPGDAGYQTAVSAMDAVVDADGHHAAAYGPRTRGDVGDDVHGCEANQT